MQHNKELAPLCRISALHAVQSNCESVQHEPDWVFERVSEHCRLCLQVADVLSNKTLAAVASDNCFGLRCAVCQTQAATVSVKSL